mmetsp:Transcript_17779/g.58173  ORF Transcript_17779/g.58173 Transcript_17779/m.58173 type:complete len:768 (+) Transcript_17779:1113-3416(+)
MLGVCVPLADVREALSQALRVPRTHSLLERELSWRLGARWRIREHFLKDVSQRSRDGELKPELKRVHEIFLGDGVAQALLAHDARLFCFHLCCLLLLGDVGPDVERSIGAPSREQLPIAAHRQAPHLVLVSVKRAEAFAAVGSPNLEEAVSRNGGELHAGGHKGELEHARGVAFEHAQARAVRKAPQPHRLVPGGGGDHLLDRGKLDGPHASLVSAQRVLEHELRERPDFGGAIPRAGDDERIGRRDSGSVDILVVRRDRRQHPQLRHSIVSPPFHTFSFSSLLQSLRKVPHLEELVSAAAHGPCNAARLEERNSRHRRDVTLANSQARACGYVPRTKRAILPPRDEHSAARLRSGGGAPFPDRGGKHASVDAKDSVRVSLESCCARERFGIEESDGVAVGRHSELAPPVTLDKAEVDDIIAVPHELSRELHPGGGSSRRLVRLVLLEKEEAVVVRREHDASPAGHEMHSRETVAARRRRLPLRRRSRSALVETRCGVGAPHLEHPSFADGGNAHAGEPRARVASFEGARHARPGREDRQPLEHLVRGNGHAALALLDVPDVDHLVVRPRNEEVSAEGDGERGDGGVVSAQRADAFSRRERPQTNLAIRIAREELQALRLRVEAQRRHHSLVPAKDMRAVPALGVPHSRRSVGGSRRQERPRRVHLESHCRELVRLPRPQHSSRRRVQPPTLQAPARCKHRLTLAPERESSYGLRVAFDGERALARGCLDELHLVLARAGKNCAIGAQPRRRATRGGEDRQGRLLGV